MKNSGLHKVLTVLNAQKKNIYTNTAEEHQNSFYSSLIQRTGFAVFFSPSPLAPPPVEETDSQYT